MKLAKERFCFSEWFKVEIKNNLNYWLSRAKSLLKVHTSTHPDY